MDQEDLMRELRDMERLLERRFLELNDKIHDVSERVATDIATLKSQSATLGFLAGIVPSVFLFLFDFFKDRGH